MLVGSPRLRRLAPPPSGPPMAKPAAKELINRLVVSASPSWSVPVRMIASCPSSVRPSNVPPTAKPLPARTALLPPVRISGPRPKIRPAKKNSGSVSSAAYGIAPKAAVPLSPTPVSRTSP